MLKMKSALSRNGILRFSVVRTTGYSYRRISVCDGTELQPILTAMATKNAESMPAVWCSQLRPLQRREISVLVGQHLEMGRQEVKKKQNTEKPIASVVR